jgi:hypothetical protein
MGASRAAEYRLPATAVLVAAGEHADLNGAQHAIVDAELVDLPVEVRVGGEGRTTDEVVTGVAQIRRPQGGWGLLCVPLNEIMSAFSSTTRALEELPKYKYERPSSSAKA